MKKITILFLLATFHIASLAQKPSADSTMRVIQHQKDSTLRALMHADSIKVEKDFAEKIKMQKLMTIATYPLLKGGEKSGVVPVINPTEITDPTMDYKLLFDVASTDPETEAKEINTNLTEVARVINLHIASGIPVKKIFPVIIVHGSALNAITNNAYYQEHFKADNPNIKLINDLSSLGAKFIACGQAMAFLEIKKEALLPMIKVAVSAKTALSTYQLKGYVKY